MTIHSSYGVSTSLEETNKRALPRRPLWQQALYSQPRMPQRYTADELAEMDAQWAFERDGADCDAETALQAEPECLPACQCCDELLTENVAYCDVCGYVVGGEA